MGVQVFPVSLSSSPPGGGESKRGEEEVDFHLIAARTRLAIGQ
jgi:hypothetical protein